MPLSIRNPQTEKLARELADRTGESLTEAKTVALRERLDSVRRESTRGRARQRAERLLAEFDLLPDLDSRTFDEILAYDDRGLP